MQKEKRYQYPLFAFRIHPAIHKKFKEICVREGDTMTRKIENWIIQYINEHEKGNPQSKLVPKEPSLLEQIVAEDHSEEIISPQSGKRMKREKVLAEWLRLNPGKSRAVGFKFAKDYGLTLSKVEEYMRELGHPIKLMPRRRRSF